MAFIVTRIGVGDYEAWKPMFDKDAPGARQAAIGHRVLRGADDRNEVYVVVEYASADDARVGRDRVIASGVLDRFEDKDLPRVVEEAEAVVYRPTPGDAPRTT